MSGVSSQPPGSPIYYAMTGLGGTARRKRVPVARPMSGLSSQPPGAPVHFALMGMFGDDGLSILTPTVEDPAVAQSASDKLDEILRRQKEEQRARKLAQLVAIAGSLFAAVRLGIIAVPHIRKRIAGE